MSTSVSSPASAVLAPPRAVHTSRATSRPALQPLVALHALAWLVIGNAIGLLLATLLLAPDLGRWLGPITYGRLMPLHLDAQLYGWFAVPLLGLLFRAYGETEGGAAGRRPHLALTAWSGALLFGAVTWLRGESSGKPFLEWHGTARWLFVAVLGLLAIGLAIPVVRHRRRDGRLLTAMRATGLPALLTVPIAMAIATDPDVYPPINPDSGGPTGGSLLGSTLGILWLFALVPFLLGRPRRTPATSWRTGHGVFFTLLALHTALFLALDHGDHSHHEPLQVLALASLAIWPLLLARFLARFRWPSDGRLWLIALAGWGVLLLTTAIPTFLPGLLEELKFTNALVAHAHLAMAGMSSAFVVLLLTSLLETGPLEGLFGEPAAFRLWHGGVALYVVSMFALGILESQTPGLVFRRGPVVLGLYAVRWIAGAGMVGASLLWLTGAIRRVG